ncbi:MAG: Trk system potassium transporter TrkA [Planctomycetota bacterium]
MNVLIVGLGEVGSHLAKVLSQEGKAVTVLDFDSLRLKSVADNLDVNAVKGDGSRLECLERADASSADLLLAVSNDDRVNMLTCLFGRRMGAKKTVLRVKDMTSIRRFRTFYRKNLQYDLLLSLEDLAADEIVKTIRQNQAVGVETFAEGKIQLRRLRLTEESSMLGIPVKELKIPDGVLIAAIDRDHEIIIPGGDDVLASGDEMFVLGEPKAMATLEKKTGVRPTYLHDVLLYGASGTTAHVSNLLARLRVQTRILVEDREEAERLSAELDGATVLHGQGTDLSLLQEERVGEADAFLGLSHDDEKNLMACQLARSLGVARTVALVQKSDYVSIYEKIGIDVAVSPRLLCANRILSFIRAGSVSSIASFEEGKAEVLEVEVRPGSKLVGRTLAKAGFPRGCVVGAIARESGDILIPRGEDVVQAGDSLVLFALRAVLDKALNLAGVAKG